MRNSELMITNFRDGISDFHAIILFCCISVYNILL